MRAVGDACARPAIFVKVSVDSRLAFTRWNKTLMCRVGRDFDILYIYNLQDMESSRRPARLGEMVRETGSVGSKT
jgi:hypothetical protein